MCGCSFICHLVLILAKLALPCQASPGNSEGGHSSHPGSSGELASTHDTEEHRATDGAYTARGGEHTPQPDPVQRPSQPATSRTVAPTGSKAQPPAHVVVGLQGQETWLSLSHSLFFHQSTPNTIEGQKQFQRTSKHLLKSQEKVIDLFADVTAAVFFFMMRFTVK